MKNDRNSMIPQSAQGAPTRGRLALAVALGLAALNSAHAFEFSSGAFSGTVDTTVTYGVGVRVAERADDLVGKCSFPTCFVQVAPGVVAPLAAVPNPVQRAARGRFSVNSDDGNLKYDDGDIISNLVRVTSELSWTYGDNVGGLIRGTAFYDFENNRRDDISDLAKKRIGRDVQLLDAFVYFNGTPGGREATLRLGRQVVNWGESTFITQGINVINAVDVARLRTPGAELKDALLPLDMVWASAQLTDSLSVEGLYMLEFEELEPEPSGTYFSTNDFAALGGEFLMLNFGLVPPPADFRACGAILSSPTTGPGAIGSSDIRRISCTAAVGRLPDRYASRWGQYGLAARYFSEALNNTEFGFFFLNYHSRLPLLSGRAVSNSFGPPSAGYFAEYPENIKLYGVSFNTLVEQFGVAVQGEVSYRPNVPLQIDDVELLFAALSPLNVAIPQPYLRFTSQLGSLRPGQEIRGWERHKLSQAQVTFTKVFGPGNVLRADQIAAVLEFGATKVWDLPPQSVLRYQGDGTDVCGGGDVNSGFGRCPAQQIGGFPDQFSWGYRSQIRADYNNFLGSPFNVSPRLAFNHDVKGTTPGPGGNFIQSRRSLSVGVEANYLNQWSVDLAYTNFFGAGSFNLIRDRDFVGFTARYAF